MKNKQLKRVNLNILVISICIALLVPMVSVFAASTLLTYKGKYITDKDSVNSFELKKIREITINHSNDKWDCDGRSKKDLYVCIQVMKKGWLFYSNTGNSFKVYALKTKKQKFTEDPGTYKLHFYTNEYSADIHGNVK